MKLKGLVFAMLMGLALTFGATAAFAGDAAKGKTLFESTGKCKTCHKTDSTKLVGPGLAGVKSRHSEAWLKKWVGGPQAVWDANDPEVQELKKRVGKEGKPKTAMAPGKLTDAEIDDVVAFITSL